MARLVAGTVHLGVVEAGDDLAVGGALEDEQHAAAVLGADPGEGHLDGDGGGEAALHAARGGQGEGDLRVVAAHQGRLYEAEEVRSGEDGRLRGDVNGGGGGSDGRGATHVRVLSVMPLRLASRPLSLRECRPQVTMTRMYHIIHQKHSIVNIFAIKQHDKRYTKEMKTKLLIFGITGDLSTRKLLPALSAIKKTGNFNDVEVIGVSRRETEGDEILQSVQGDTSGLASLAVFKMNVAAAEDYVRLRDYLALQPNEQLLVYLSVPPTAASQIVDFMGQTGLCTDNVKILFEKPFGVDLSSAQQVIEQAAKYYKESQIYRIDHYLAKEMAQNIVAFRGGNALFAHIWDSASIEKVELRATETIGIEGRAGFYEQTGALRDVLQGHLMQLLALTLMDIPNDLNWNELPEKRYEALHQLSPADPQKAVRAQYDSYETEVENPGTLTETFVSLTLFSNDPRWKGVPLVLTTGKGLSEKTTEVKIHFRKNHEAQSNCLVLHIQPNEGIEIELFTKKPGYDREFEAQKLSFSYPDDTVLPDAYEQVIVDAIRSHKSLFTSSDEVLESWRVLQPLLDTWGMDAAVLPKYAKGLTVESITKAN